MRIGVLALQGDFQAHATRLEQLGAETILVRGAADLEHLDGLVLPGGESSTMLKLLREEGLLDPLRVAISSGLATLATCAGMILLAKNVSRPEQRSLELVDIDVERNGYGRQLHSGIFRLESDTEFPRCTGVFIRAPRITRVGRDCEVLATRNDDAVLVRQGSILAACFHPELDDAHPLYDLFLRSVGLQHS